MSVTRTQIQTLIQSVLSGNGSLSTWADLESYLFSGTNSILNALYPTTTVNDDQSTTNIFTANNALKLYDLSIVKQGRVVTVSGTIRNTTGAITPADSDWFTITTTEYQQDSNTIYFTGVSQTDGSAIQLILGSNTFGVFEPLGTGETVYVNFSYFTNA